jgi:hypothetical protein
VSLPSLTPTLSLIVTRSHYDDRHRRDALSCPVESRLEVDLAIHPRVLPPLRTVPPDPRVLPIPRLTGLYVREFSEDIIKKSEAKGDGSDMRSSSMLRTYERTHERFRGS